MTTEGPPRYAGVITRGLRRGLLITGPIALIVLAEPSLVLLGFFLLIVPGLILAIIPTVFLYLALFSLAWFGLSKHGPIAAASGGVALLFLVGIQAPYFVNWEISRRLEEAAAGEVSPPGPIGGAGTVEVEIPDAGRSVNCDQLCQLLLYNGGASRVVMASPRGAAIAYRLSSEGCDVSPARLRDLERGLRWNLTGREALTRAVRMRTAGQECVVSASAVPRDAALTIRWLETRNPGGGWRAPGISTEGVEVLAGRKVVARRTVRRTWFFRLPLYVGLSHDLRQWGWGKRWTPEARSEVDRLAMLKQLTKFNLETPGAPDSADIRRALDATLDNPSGSSAGFALVPDYFELLRKEGFEAEDTGRVARLIEDDRIEDFSLFRSEAAPLKDALRPALRDAMLRRLGRLDTDDRQAIASLERAAGHLPKDTYRDAVPLLDELLAKPARRHLYPTLIPRLAEQGSLGAQKLAGIIEDALRRPGRSRGEEARAATEGLCIAAAGARPVLPKLQDLHERFQEVPFTRNDQWRGMLVALGADPSQFSDSHRDPLKYRDQLRRAATRCGRSR